MPPGDYLTSFAATLAEQGDIVSEERLEQMRVSYGLGEPIPNRYFKWIGNIVLRGDFGRSLEWRIPVNQIIWNRIGYTVLINISTILFVWKVEIQIGVFS
ncbi:MAG: ABC transporter permease, partial [Anaerolineae bacterium]|nr:ABC transporter permease [Anaerolineae bacterium]